MISRAGATRSNSAARSRPRTSFIVKPATAAMIFSWATDVLRGKNHPVFDKLLSVHQAEASAQVSDFGVTRAEPRNASRITAILVLLTVPNAQNSPYIRPRLRSERMTIMKKKLQCGR